MRKEISAPGEWLGEVFEQRRQASHDMNAQTLKEAIRRRERIRSGLAFAGAIVAFCGIGSMESGPINAGSMVACAVGLLMIWIAAMIIRAE